MSTATEFDRTHATSSDVDRVAVYIDGFNLYMALKESGFGQYRWMNLVRFCEGQLRPNQQLVDVHYFTAKVNPGAKGRRQRDFLYANEGNQKLTIHEGKFGYQSTRCPSCKHKSGKPVEKQSDVKLATQMAMDAAADRFDTAMIVSTDSDFIGAISILRQHYVAKRFVISVPPGRTERAEALFAAATGWTYVNEATLRIAKMPDTVQLASGREVHRPPQWT